MVMQGGEDLRKAARCPLCYSMVAARELKLVQIHRVDVPKVSPCVCALCRSVINLSRLGATATSPHCQPCWVLLRCSLIFSPFGCHCSVASSCVIHSMCCLNPAQQDQSNQSRPPPKIAVLQQQHRCCNHYKCNALASDRLFLGRPMLEIAWSYIQQ